MQRERIEHREELERLGRGQREEVETMASQARSREEDAKVRNCELIQRHTRDIEELRQQHQKELSDLRAHLA